MKRSGRIARHTPLPRASKPMRARNPKRHGKNWTRSYGSPERCAFVAGLPCSVSMCPRQPSENAHSVGGGASRKADAATVLPLCSAHHRILHTVGVETFQKQFHLSLAACAERTERAWVASQEAA